MQTRMRKFGKAPLNLNSDDRVDTRPRGISGATITSWDGPRNIDPDALFAASDRQVSVIGAASAEAPADEQISFASISQFATIAVI